MTSSLSNAASFNCNKASTKNEIAICSDPELSTLDEVLAATYKQTRGIVSDANKLKNELRNYKKIFENNFYGLNLYETSGCSKARLSEYLECLIETDGEDCRIYYTQMRLVD